MEKKRFVRYGCFLLVLFGTVLFFSACGNTDTTANKTYAATSGINIATKNTPEQNILANIAKLLIKEKMGVDAKIVYYDDSTSATLLNKLDHQEIQLFFDYSGSLAVNALNIDTNAINVATLLVDVQNAVKKQYDISVSEKIGYNSSTAFYMMSARNTKLGSPSSISAIADKSKQLTIGMEESFYNRIDCYQAICQKYNLHFKNAKVYSEEDGFMALANGDIDIFVADSVSPYYSLYDVIQLKDNQYFFLPQEACCLVSNQALKSYPELESTLALMEGMISTSRMSLMIKRIYWEGNNIEDYLHTYLRANNMI